MAMTPRRKRLEEARKASASKIISPGSALPSLLPAIKPIARPGEAAPGAPKLGKTGSVNIGGTSHPVNASGIISSGPYKGKYPMEIINQDPIRQRAKDAVDVQLNPQISQLERRAQAERDAANQLIEQGHADTTAYTGSVGTLYDKLRQQMEAGNQKVQQGWETAKTQTGSAYDQLMTVLGESMGAARQNTEGMAQKLGIEAALPQATEGIAKDNNLLSGLFGLQRQSANDYLTGLGLVDSSYGNRINNAASATGTQYQARALEENLRNAANIRGEATRNITEYLGQAGDIEATRGGMLRENIAALEDARAQAQSEAEAAAFDREILLAKLELQREELGIEADYKAGQLDIDREKLGIDKQRVAIEARKTEAQLQKEARALQPGSLEYLEKMAAIDLKRAQTKKTIADYTKPADPAKFGKGRVGAERYLASMGDQSLVQTGMHEVTLAMQYGKDYPSAVKFMRNNFSKFSELRDPNIQKALLNALDLAWEGNKAPAKK